LNRLQLLKTLAPGFLPLLAFIVADALWGTEIGLGVGVASGLIELAVSFFREKTWDRFVLLDTMLIVVLGGISLLLENDIFFRLKPALIELIFCLVLGVSVYSPVNILLAMSRRYLKGVELEPEQAQAMTRSMRTLFYIFLAHTALIVYAAFALSAAAWGFISGGLFYILFAAYLLVEWLRNRRRARLVQAEYAGEEWFDIVDAEGNVRGKAPRSVCHSQKGLLHPVVHLHVLDAGGRLFLQKRSPDKQVQPGKWDTAVGGHVASGENIEDALKREAEEELGLSGFLAVPVVRYVWESDVESELVYMFITRWDGPLRPDPGEISEGKFWKISEIREALADKILTPNLEFEFAILLKTDIRKVGKDRTGKVGGE
jgi:isopentenyldiphosphate isomerase/intracellular septation protein A